MESAAMRLLRRVLESLVADAPRVVSDSQWSRLLDALFPLVVQARRASLGDAVDVMVREAERFDLEPLDDLREPFYDRRALDDALTRTVREPLLRGEDRPVVQRAAQAAVERHVQQAGRESVIVAVESSERSDSPVGWARRLTGAENCGFCVMLASRGAVYKSRSTAGGDERKFHDGCDCAVVPVYDVNDWPGIDGFVEANRRYRRALELVDAGGRKGDNVLNALRRDLAASPFALPGAG